MIACAGGTPAPRRARRPPPPPPAPVVTLPPSACRALPADAAAAQMFDAFFRAHAEGRIDPDCVDAHGAAVPQVPLATELVCPEAAHEVETLPDGRTRVALALRTGRAGDVVDTEVIVSRPDGRPHIEVDGLARMRGDLQAAGLGRLLRDHPEVEQLGALDVPFEDDFPDAEGLSPRRRLRAEHDLRLVFARGAAETVMCLLEARDAAVSASTRSWCWRDPRRVDRVVVGQPMVVDETVQLTLVLVPVPPGRAEAIEVRLPGMEVRPLGPVTARPAPLVPAWDGRAREGVVLPGRFTPRPGAWAALVAVEAPPPWLATFAAAPWLRATPVASPPDRPATAITVDLEETRRWLAVRGPAGWAFGVPLERPAADGMTSWDGVEPGPEGTLRAWSSDFGHGEGTARVHLVREERGRLVEQARAVVGRVRAAWSGDRRTAQRVRWELVRAPADECTRLRVQRADTAVVTRDFQPIPSQPRTPLDPGALGTTEEGCLEVR